MPDPITELQAAWRHHIDIACALAQTLNAIQKDPVTALQTAVTVYDHGDDPNGTALRAALAASIPDEWARE